MCTRVGVCVSLCMCMCVVCVCEGESECPCELDYISPSDRHTIAAAMYVLLQSKLLS